MKVIYYYQTFVGLYKMLSHIKDLDVMIISSIHFGVDKNNKPNIYLNDNIPDDKIFNKMWIQTIRAYKLGCKIMLMMGGAGLAYQKLFQNFEIYYPLLIKTIKDRPWITGIDLDIEELVKIEDV